MPTIEGPITECPQCGAEVWDNRGKKKNPKGPDFKCRQNSEHAFWLPKQAFPEKVARPKPAPEGTEPRPATGSRDDDIVALYTDSLDRVLAKLKQEKLTDFFQSADIAAMCATLFIARSKG